MEAAPRLEVSEDDIGPRFHRHLGQHDDAIAEPGIGPLKPFVLCDGVFEPVPAFCVADIDFRPWRREENPLVVAVRSAERFKRWLARGVLQSGDTIDFYLSPTRNTKAAKRFLGKALHGMKDWEKPLKINTDKSPTYGPAIATLKAEGKCPQDTIHRQVKYLNNVVEADHGKLKRLIKPTLGFKSMKTAYATLKGFEVMHALRKGQAALWQYGGGIMGEVRLIERNFGVYTA